MSHHNLGNGVRLGRYGFLSGTEEEKMPPRWSPVWTNLEVLTQTESDEWMGSSGTQ